MTKQFYLLSSLALISLLASCSPKVGGALATTELSAALPAGTSYAVLHLYRPARVAGFAVGYDVRLNDSVVYRASNGSQTLLRRAQPGAIKLSAKTESKEEFTLTLQPGREYYVRCTLGAGLVVGTPHLEQMSATEGSQAVARLQKPADTAPTR